MTENYSEIAASEISAARLLHLLHQLGEDDSVPESATPWESRRRIRQSESTRAALVREERDRQLTEQLRAEANSLKECVTRYSFQAVSICGFMAAAIIELLKDNKYVGLGAVGIIPILLITARMATYKYATANRHFGYELHLSRTKSVPPEFFGRWRDDYRDISWEEAMRAWRVVHGALLRAIYDRSCPLDKYKTAFQPKTECIWFSQESLGSPETGKVWHPGTYLFSILLFMYCVAIMAMVLLSFSVVYIIRNEPSINWRIAVSLVELGSVLLVAWRAVADWSRLKVLEDGLLSIHACAIIWQAVTIAHFEAVSLSRSFNLPSSVLHAAIGTIDESTWEQIRQGSTTIEDVARSRLNQVTTSRTIPDGAGLRGYAYWLGQIAESLRRRPQDIQNWIGGQ